MLGDIIGDLFKVYKKQVIQVVAFVLSIVLLAVVAKVAWNYYDTKHLEEVIEDQKKTIDNVVDINKKEADKARKDREAQQEAADRVIDHIDKQTTDAKEIDSIKEDMYNKLRDLEKADIVGIAESLGSEEVVLRTEPRQAKRRVSAVNVDDATEVKTEAVKLVAQIQSTRSTKPPDDVQKLIIARQAMMAAHAKAVAMSTPT